MTDLTSEVRAIFVKNTVPDGGDPELTLFDTDQIIADFTKMLEVEKLKARLQELENIEVHKEHPRKWAQQRRDVLEADVKAKEKQSA